jgi:hypothetical protein
MNAQSLDQYRANFRARKLLAMPTAGLLAWLVVALVSPWLTAVGKIWLLFSATGSIFFLAVMIAPLFSEDLLGRNRAKNPFDALFLSAVLGAWLVFAIAIPFLRKDYTSLPLTLGVMTGLMWPVFSWIIQHWIGYFHAIGRTTLLVVCWYLFPEHRFVVLPLIVVGFYVITLVVLVRRVPATSMEGQPA